MTYLDRFKREHPTLDADYIMDMYCPDDKLVSMICEETDGLPDCRKCWARLVEPTADFPADAPQVDIPEAASPQENAARSAGPDDGITVVGPIHDPDAGLSAEGPDRT